MFNGDDGDELEGSLELNMFVNTEITDSADYFAFALTHVYADVQLEKIELPEEHPAHDWRIVWRVSIPQGVSKNDVTETAMTLTKEIFFERGVLVPFVVETIDE